MCANWPPGTMPHGPLVTACAWRARQPQCRHRVAARRSLGVLMPRPFHADVAPPRRSALEPVPYPPRRPTPEAAFRQRRSGRRVRAPEDRNAERSAFLSSGRGPRNPDRAGRGTRNVPRTRLRSAAASRHAAERRPELSRTGSRRPARDDEAATRQAGTPPGRRGSPWRPGSRPRRPGWPTSPAGPR